MWLHENKISIVDDNEALTYLYFQLLEAQKPSKRVELWKGNDFDKCNKISSQYSTYGIIFIA
jgi:hypothetical protein